MGLAIINQCTKFELSRFTRCEGVHGTVPTGSIPTGIVPTGIVPTDTVPTALPQGIIHRESKKTRHQSLAHNFTKYLLIFTILSLLNSVVNL